MRFSVALVLALSVLVPSGAAARPIAGTTCQTFPADNYWRADITGLPVHPRSDEWLAHMSSGRDLHPDFGPNAGGHRLRDPDHRRAA
jgi:hypothetical protein